MHTGPSSAPDYLECSGIQVLPSACSDVTSTKTVKYKYEYKYPSLKYKYKYLALKYKYEYKYPSPKSQVQVPGFLQLHIDYSSKDDVKIVLSCKLTNQKENCCREHKSVTKCCCTTLSDQSELSVLRLRKMSCDTTLSQRRALCGRIISPPWLKKPFQLLRWRLEHSRLAAPADGACRVRFCSCARMESSRSRYRPCLDIFEPAAECCQMLDVTTTGGCSWQRALNFFSLVRSKN